MMEHRKAVSLGPLFQPLLALCCLAVAALLVAACSSVSGNVSTSGMGAVTTMISDPATCATPNGPFSHVFVTITDVKAHTSPTAGANDSGWVDLTPSLASAPKQVDLLGLANNQCFLASLGDAQQIQAGTYQQIRVILASDSTSISSNACGNGSANCVELSKDSLSFHTLNLASEDQTGIKIPPGQIASGGLTVAAGKTTDLDIDFQTCQSIVLEGNGQYRLKPVLHAGEVSTVSASINGTVLDGSTGKARRGHRVGSGGAGRIPSGVDRVIQSTIANPDGTFVFCPLAAGNYDVVVSGVRASDGALYPPSIITGVAVGDTTGNIKLNPPTAGSGEFVCQSERPGNFGEQCQPHRSYLDRCHADGARNRQLRHLHDSAATCRNAVLRRLADCHHGYVVRWERCRLLHARPVPIASTTHCRFLRSGLTSAHGPRVEQR